MAFDAKVLAAVRTAFPGAGSAAVVSLGAPVHDGQCHPEPLVGIPLAMMNRHGLIAGRDRHRQDQDAPADRRAALGGRRPGVRRRRQGRRLRPRGAGRAGDRDRRAREGDRRRLEARRLPVEFLSLTRQAGRAAPRDGVVVRAAALGEGAGPQRHAVERAVAGVQVLRRPRAAAARLHRPARGAAPPDRRRRAGAEARLRRHLEGDGGRAAARDGRAGAAGRGRVLRRAGVRPRRPAGARARRPRAGQRPRAVRRAGQAGAVLDLHDVDARASSTTSFPRSATSTSRSWCSSSTRRTCCSTTRARRSSTRSSRSCGWSARRASASSSSRRARRTCRPTILGQLGNRVQHALRAFTPDDEKALRAAARTFPKTPFYDIAGDADHARDRRGAGDRARRRTARRRRRSSTRMAPPASRMGPLTPAEIAPLLATEQVRRYAAAVDRESAYEILGQRLEPGDERPAPPAPTAPPSKPAAPAKKPRAPGPRRCARRSRARSRTRSRAA